MAAIPAHERHRRCLRLQPADRCSPDVRVAPIGRWCGDGPSCLEAVRATERSTAAPGVAEKSGTSSRLGILGACHHQIPGTGVVSERPLQSLPPEQCSAGANVTCGYASRTSTTGRIFRSYEAYSRWREAPQRERSRRHRGNPRSMQCPYPFLCHLLHLVPTLPLPEGVAEPIECAAQLGNGRH